MNGKRCRIFRFPPARVFSAGLWALLLSASLCAAEGRRPFEPARIGTSRLLHVEGTPLLVLEGGPAEMGKAHGTLLKHEAEILIRSYLVPAALLQGGMARLEARARSMEPALPERYRVELHALAEALGRSFDTVLTAAAFPDVYRGGGCSTLAVTGERSKEGGPLLARNLDFFPMNVLNRYGVVIVFRPRGFHAFASVTWPGLAGVLSGMNERGLCAAVMEVRSGRRDFTAMPSAFLFRRVLEEAATVEEGLALLEKTPRAASNNLMLLDASGAAAVAEIGPDRFAVRRPEGGVLYATNHHRAGRAAPPSGGRYGTLARFCRSRGKLGLADLKEALDAVNQGRITVQSMIFRPRDLVLHLSMGPLPASRGPFRKVPLASFLRDGTPAAGERKERDDG